MNEKELPGCRPQSQYLGTSIELGWSVSLLRTVSSSGHLGFPVMTCSARSKPLRAMSWGKRSMSGKVPETEGTALCTGSRNRRCSEAGMFSVPLVVASFLSIARPILDGRGENVGIGTEQKYRTSSSDTASVTTMTTRTSCLLASALKYSKRRNRRNQLLENQKPHATPCCDITTPRVLLDKLVMQKI